MIRMSRIVGMSHLVGMSHFVDVPRIVAENDELWGHHESQDAATPGASRFASEHDELLGQPALHGQHAP